MRSEVASELDEEIRIHMEAALGRNVQFHHPALDPVGIELLVPSTIKGVSEVNAPAITADFDHLRSAVEWLCRILGVGGASHDATQMHGARELGMEGIRNVVLAHLTRTPARHIKESVVER